MAVKHYTLAEIAKFVGGKVVGDEKRVIEGLAPLDSATSSQLSFHIGKAYDVYLSHTQSVVMLHKDSLPLCQSDAILCDSPYLAFAQAANLFKPSISVHAGAHSSANIHPSSTVPESCSIGAHVSIAADVVLGENCIVYPGCVIGERSRVGDRCKFMPNVTIYHDCQLGDDVLIQSGAVIGSEGFGHAQNKQKHWVLIPQLGGVIIRNKAEIGANTTIDRGALNHTIIGEGVIIDNLVQIAHNVEVGDHTAIAACVGISGSVVIGKHCQIAGQVGIAGHLSITDNVVLLARCAVTKSITKPGIYSGILGCQERMTWNKNAARFRQLDRLLDKLLSKLTHKE